VLSTAWAETTHFERASVRALGPGGCGLYSQHGGGGGRGRAEGIAGPGIEYPSGILGVEYMSQCQT